MNGGGEHKPSGIGEVIVRTTFGDDNKEPVSTSRANEAGFYHVQTIFDDEKGPVSTNQPSIFDQNTYSLQVTMRGS
jgi:hypothetical protein